MENLLDCITLSFFNAASLHCLLEDYVFCTSDVSVPGSVADIEETFIISC